MGKAQELLIDLKRTRSLSSKHIGFEKNSHFKNNWIYKVAIFINSRST